MSAPVTKKLEGLFSLIWVALGFALFTSWSSFPGFDSPYSFFLAVFVAWWGVGLMFAISGVRRGSRVSVFGGWLIIIGFVIFLIGMLVPRIHT